jgi:protein-S-isoprenylcysteine O-methyltransferase Ste14
VFSNEGFKRHLRQDGATDRSASSREIREATQSHACYARFASPVPGECRSTNCPARRRIVATILHLAIVLWMAIPFPYFMTAGANIFTVPKLRDNGAVLGQISFISGMVCVLVMGLFYRLLVPAAVCGAILALAAVILYEWTRRTVIDRNFYVGLAGEVPPALCDAGPYRYVRHLFYLSYMVAFVGVAVAFPSLVVTVVCALNIGLFVDMALDDERVLLASPLGAAYTAYRERVGMFVLRFNVKR